MLRQPFDKSTTQVCAHAPVLPRHLPVRKGLCLEPKIGPGQCISVHNAVHVYTGMYDPYTVDKMKSKAVLRQKLTSDLRLAILHGSKKITPA